MYERFDGTLAQTVSLPLKWDGVKHVLQSVLAGLAHMHARGVVHTDVSPKNIFLRGAGPHRRAWSRALRRGCISQDSPLADPETKPEVTAAFDAHLPCTFEVGGEAPPEKEMPLEQARKQAKPAGVTDGNEKEEAGVDNTVPISCMRCGIRYEARELTAGAASAPDYCPQCRGECESGLLRAKKHNCREC